MRKFKIVFASLLVVLSISVLHAATIVMPGSYTTSIGHYCAAGDDEWCKTDAVPLTHLGAPYDIPGGDSFGSVLRSQYPKWKVTYGGQLTGTIHVTSYDAHLCDSVNLPGGWVAGDPYTRDKDTHCVHGVELSMWYEPNFTDPVIPAGQSFHWIQEFVDWGGYCGYTEAPHDVIDCTENMGPFYYEASEEQHIVATGHQATWFLDAPQNGCWCHGDSCPGALCPKPCDWGALVYTFMAVGTPGTGPGGAGTMTVYDGFYWGFNAECVPEPATVMLLCIGSLALLHKQKSG